MSFIDEMRKFVREHDDMANAAFDLWTWLPSYHFARREHGDYAADVAQPTFADLMKEATMVLSYAAGYDKDFDGDEAKEWFGCSCEDCRYSKQPTQEELEELFTKYRQGNKE